MPNHAETDNFTGSQYTLRKFLKHTMPHYGMDINSVFSTTDYDTYKDYMINTQESGSVEFDKDGRKNIVWVAGYQNGITYINGVPALPNDAVKVVLPDDINKIHCYPTSSFAMSLQTCNDCGKSIFS